MTTPDRLTELDEETCRQLLASADVGRIALNDEPSPTVLPVNFLVHRDRVVFRSAGGGKLDAAREHLATASFQVDGVDRDRNAGWSVLVRGALEVIPEPEADLEQALAQLSPLPGGERPYVMVIHIESIAGRRIRPETGWVLDHLATNRWTGRDASDLMG